MSHETNSHIYHLNIGHLSITILYCTFQQVIEEFPLDNFMINFCHSFNYEKSSWIS